MRNDKPAFDMPDRSVWNEEVGTKLLGKAMIDYGFPEGTAMCGYTPALFYWWNPKEGCWYERFDKVRLSLKGADRSFTIAERVDVPLNADEAAKLPVPIAYPGQNIRYPSWVNSKDEPQDWKTAALIAVYITKEQKGTKYEYWDMAYVYGKGGHMSLHPASKSFGFMEAAA